MPETVITVQGSFSAFYPAERATLSIAVGWQSGDAATSLARVVEDAEQVRASIGGITDAANGPVTWWSSDSVQTWVEKPWNKDGKQLPLVHHARATFSVKFSDFSALAEWIQRSSKWSAVSVRSIEWALTVSRKSSAIAEVRSRAVKDAVAKAAVYAQSIGLGSVHAIAIADPGMLGDDIRGSGTPSGSYSRASSKMGDESEPSLSLKPEDIEIEAKVDAKFIAS